jgi:hypothetical protein
MTRDPSTIGDILDRLEACADENDRVTLGAVVGSFGHRSYGPFLLVPALIEVSPIGGIPGLPTVLAGIIILFAVQMLFGRRNLWLPGFLERRSVGANRMRKAVEALRPLARRMDRWFHGRLERFTRGPMIRVAAGSCIVLACTVPPLELLPFASTAPMAAIAAFGLALLVRDGLLMLVASALALGSLGLGGWLIASGRIG